MRSREEMLMRMLHTVEANVPPVSTNTVDALFDMFPWQDRIAMSLPVRIPFAHVTRYMMCPLYVDPHLSYVNRFLTYLHVLESGNGSQAGGILYHEASPDLTVLDPVQIARYIRIVSTLHTLLRRMCQYVFDCIQ